jgi:RND family efflux transporter MFP subunit
MNHIPYPQQKAEPSEQETPLNPGLERRRRRSALLLGLGALAMLAVLVTIGASGHAARRAATIATLDAARAAVPVVHVAPVKTADSAREVDLPGTLQAFDTATLFARATGYIGKRNVDIGSQVHAGDVLAVISAPDLDQQLAQARGQLAQMQAALAQAEANQDLAHVTNNRTSQLVKDGWDTLQQGDNDRLTLASTTAGVGVARANIVAQQAVVGRLEQLVGFENVVAPFTGVITSRLVDTGSLVTADGANNATPLFSIARSDVLRVQIYVPQEVLFGLKVGDPAEATVPELPDQVFHGTVARDASQLDQQTRTVLTEVDVDNPDGKLTAGLYGVVHLKEPRPTSVVLVPSQAVIFDKNGLSAAVYENGVARLRHLDLEADDGAQVEVRAGLEPGDQLILNPPVGLSDGMKVATTSETTKVAAVPAAKH